MTATGGDMAVAAGVTSVVLADGRGVVVRELSAADAPALVAVLETAPAEDLRRRYLGCPPPASFLVRRLTEADGTHHAYLGAFTPDGILVGVAQFDRAGDIPSAEVAVQVAPDWQHDGLGTALLQNLAHVARRRGVTRFTATYFADNRALRRLLRDLGHPVVSTYADGEATSALDLGGGTGGNGLAPARTAGAHYSGRVVARHARAGSPRGVHRPGTRHEGV